MAAMGGHDGMRRSRSAEDRRGMRLVADSDLEKAGGGTKGSEAWLWAVRTGDRRMLKESLEGRSTLDNGRVRTVERGGWTEVDW